MKKKAYLILAFLFGATTLVGCNKNEKDEVVIFLSMEEFRNEVLAEKLEERLPDIEVIVQYYSTGNSAAKIKAEGESTEADIVVGLETISFLNIIDNFADISDFDSSHYLEEFYYDDRMRIWEKFEGAIIVNKEVLEDKGLAIPTSYEDLLKEEYRDLIVMPLPKISSTGYMFLNAWVNTMGEEQAFAYVDELQKNIKQFTESGSAIGKMVAQGEAAIGLGMIFQSAKEISEGVPIEIIEPESGYPYNTTSFGIIKGREDGDNVRKVFEFLNEEFMIYDKEHFSPGQVLKEQNNYVENYPNVLKSADMSTITDQELRERLIAKWRY